MVGFSVQVEGDRALHFDYAASWFCNWLFWKACISDSYIKAQCYGLLFFHLYWALLSEENISMTLWAHSPFSFLFLFSFFRVLPSFSAICLIHLLLFSLFIVVLALDYLNKLFSLHSQKISNYYQLY